MTEELRPITLNFTGSVFHTKSEEEPKVEPVVEQEAVTDEMRAIDDLKEQIESANRNNEELHYSAVFTYDKITGAEEAIQEQDARVAEHEELVTSAVNDLEAFKGRIDTVETGLTDAQKMAQDAHNAAAANGESLAALESTVLTGSVMEYVAGSSDTVAPTEGWSENSPARTEDTPYVWMRTILTYADNKTTTTSPVLLLSDKVIGDGGATAAVISLTSSSQILIGSLSGGESTPPNTVVTGGAHNTTITQWLYSVDGKAFSATLPDGVSRSGNSVTVTGSSMSARTITVKMSDDAGNADSLTVAKVFDGAQGTDGSPGVGISSTSVEYTQSTSGSTPPSTGWTASVPTPIAGQYVWTRVTYNYTDGATKNSYSVGRIGSDGTPGDDGVKVSTSSVMYALSSSGTSTPSSGWSTVIPLATSSAPYLWTRNTITYSDGTVSNSYSVSSKGADGKDGDTGRGIVSSSTTYATSATGSTPPSGTWSQTPIAAAPGQYVWTKITLSYSDGTSSDAYAVGRYGSDGNPGDDGVGISSDMVEYAIHSSGTTPPTSGWASTPKAVSSALPYLWTRTTLTYTDNTNSVAYSVGARGVDGASGKDGNGIVSMVTAYTASSSGTTIPTTGWKSAPPTAAPGQYVWTKMETTFTDGRKVPSYAVGRMGSDGTPGDDGVGISSTTTTYVLSTTGSTPPGSSAGWGTSIPTTTTSQPFLWTKTETKYTDNSTSTAYSVSQKGTDGKDAYTVVLSNESHSFPAGTTNALAGSTTTKVTALKGATPVNATVGTITGQVSGLTTSITGNGTTSPTITISAGTSLSTKSGVLTIPVTADGTTFSKQFSWSLALTGAEGPKGANGTAGKDGVGVSSVTTYYLRQPSASAAPAAPTTLNPSASWTTTEPGYVAGNSLYRVDRVVYTNGSFSYSPVSLVTSYAIAVEALTSANGRNSIMRSTSNATGNVNPETGLPLVKGDVWVKLNTLAANGVEIGRWTWDGSAWISSTIGHQSISSVDVTSLLVTGTTRMNEAAVTRIIGDAAHFSLLTADKLVMAPGNMFPDPNLKISSDWSYLSAGGSFQTSSIISGRNAIKVTGTGSNSISQYNPLTVQLEAGASYTVSASMHSVTTAPSSTSVVIYRMSGATRTSNWVRFPLTDIASTVNSTKPVRGTARIPETWDMSSPVQVTLEVTSPAGAVSYFTDFSIIRATDSTVILPGSISTSHIDADTFRGFVISGATFVSTLEPNNPNADNVTIKDRTISVNRYDSVDNALKTTMQLGGPSGDEMILYGADGNPISGFRSDGSGVVRENLDVGSLTVGGDTLKQFVWDNSKNYEVLSYWQTTWQPPDIGSSPYGMCRFQFEMEPYHLYEIQLDFNVLGAPGDDFELAIRYHNSKVTSGMYAFDRVRYSIPTTGSGRGVHYTYRRIFGARDTNYSNDFAGYMEVMPTLQAVNTGGRPITLVANSTYPLYNTGSISHVGVPRWHWAPSDSGGGKSAEGVVGTDAASSTRSYSSEWPSSWRKSWRGSTVVSDSLQHGVHEGSRRYSMVGNGTAMRNALSGATVTKFEVFLENIHTWYGSGMTTYISPHYSTYSAPASPATSANRTISTHFGRGERRWVSLPTSWASGTFTGISLGIGAGSGVSDYGRFSFDASKVKFRATYEK